MDESVFGQPGPELLDKFAQGDPLAIDAVLRIVLPQLYQWGRRHYPRIVEHDLQSVIHDVLNEICKNYARYDPTRARFTTYAIELITKRMINIQKKRFTLLAQEESLETLSEKSSPPAYNDSEADIVRRVDREAFFRRARSQLSDVEQIFLDLMLRGETHQEAFIQALKQLGYTGNLNQEVKRAKERLKYHLQQTAQVQGLRLDDLL